MRPRVEVIWSWGTVPVAHHHVRLGADPEWFPTPDGRGGVHLSLAGSHVDCTGDDHGVVRVPEGEWTIEARRSGRLAGALDGVWRGIALALAAVPLAIGHVVALAWMLTETLPTPPIVAPGIDVSQPPAALVKAVEAQQEKRRKSSTKPKAGGATRAGSRPTLATRVQNDPCAELATLRKRLGRLSPAETARLRALERKCSAADATMDVRGGRHGPSGTIGTGLVSIRWTGEEDALSGGVRGGRGQGSSTVGVGGVEVAEGGADGAVAGDGQRRGTTGGMGGRAPTPVKPVHVTKVTPPAPDALSNADRNARSRVCTAVPRLTAPLRVRGRSVSLALLAAACPDGGAPGGLSWPEIQGAIP